MKIIFLKIFIPWFINLAVVSSVQINQMKVPTLLKNGSEEYSILDCNYSLNDSEKDGLVIKWLFNRHLVYQWIVNQKPQSLGILRDRLDLRYIADKKIYYKHRALKLLKPTTELTGDWTCRVSTFEGDAEKTLRMVIYSEEKQMGMNVSQTMNNKYNSINVSCWTWGAFPQPKLFISYHQSDPAWVPEKEDSMEVIDFKHKAYFVRVSRLIQEKWLFTSFEFQCHLIIPDTNYINTKTILYEPGNLILKGESSLALENSGANEARKQTHFIILWVTSLMIYSF